MVMRLFGVTVVAVVVMVMMRMVTVMAFVCMLVMSVMRMGSAVIAVQSRYSERHVVKDMRILVIEIVTTCNLSLLSPDYFFDIL
jgi:hypothetical protein